MFHKRSARVPKWVLILVLALFVATTALAAAQSPDLHLPLVTGEGETEQERHEAPVGEEVGEAEPDPAVEMPGEGEVEEPIASIAAFSATNWYVSNRVGVGTDVPAHRLSVIGGPTWTSHGWVGSLELANFSAIGWRTNSAGHRFGVGHTNSGFYMFRTASNPGTTGSDPVYDLFINNKGHVGIGTLTPAHKLSIAGGPQWTQSLWNGAIDLPNSSAIAWHTNNAGQRFGMGHTDGGFHIFRTTSNPGTTSGVATHDLTIDDGGNVGIGSITPFYKLHVIGNTGIHGELYVNNTKMDVPDYVFEPDYPLMPLDELRTYIAKEKHLPNVPDAEQIAQDGLNMTNFQMKLLEKTEELTLYTLAQDDQIESLQQENRAMQQTNQAQGEQLETLQQENQAMQQMIADLETRLAALEE